MKGLLGKTPYIVLTFLTLVAVSGAFSILASGSGKDKKNETKENYHRPKPTTPQLPAIPVANKYTDDKVFLENADSLYRPFSYDEERQIVKGNVKFRQGGMWMFCDSAYYYPERNSLDAFGHVEMRQGDTLFVFSDKLFYNGAEKKAVLTHGPSRGNVVLKDPKVTLTTDSLDYDIESDIGWYSMGGTLNDGENTLTSVFGQYSPTTKIAEFREDVVLVNNSDGYRMYTEDMRYYTQTGEAEIYTPTRIESENDTILTSSGSYNTRTDYAELTSRSTILHRDSAGNVITLEGDSIIYDKATHLSRAYMFHNEFKNPRPMVLTDTARKVTLIGGYGQYNDSVQSSMATIYPLLIEYSRPDTLFLRSDTIESYMRIEKAWPDSLNHNWNAATRARLRGYDGILEIAETMPLRLQLVPSKHSTPGSAPELAGMYGRTLPDPNLTAAKKATGIKRESGGSGRAPSPGNPEKPEAPGILPADAPSGREMAENPLMADTVAKMSEKHRRFDGLGRDSTFMIDKSYHVAKAIGKARFFNQDMQGIADTIIYHQYDSILNMIRKPIVWSGERQINGDVIRVHFNDSVADVAYLPEGGMIAEHIDEDFYNQLSGSHITAYLENNALKRLEIDGNVETIFLPMENDSTYNRIVAAESSYLTVEMADGQMDRLKMWPDVDGTVTPIFMLKKKEEQFLSGFRWWEFLRPRRQWYGETLKWEDELGEVPEELEQYFKQTK